MESRDNDDFENSPYYYEYTDVEKIISEKEQLLEADVLSSPPCSPNLTPSSPPLPHAVIKRKRRSMKDLNQWKYMQVWEEILDENELTSRDFETQVSSRTGGRKLIRKRTIKISEPVVGAVGMSGGAVGGGLMTKYNSTDCLVDSGSQEELDVAGGKRVLNSYSQWDVSDMYDDSVRGHRDVIDLYVKGNIVNMITGNEFSRRDKIVPFKEKSNNKENNTKKRKPISTNSTTEFKPKIIDVLYKESFIEWSLKRAQGNAAVTEFWLTERNKTFNNANAYYTQPAATAAL